MNISKTIKQKRLLSLFILLVLFLYVFYFSANTLWLEDDANYMFKFVINDTPTITNTSDEYISSLSDVIESQYAHYFVSNGRIVAHTIVQLINPFLSRSVFALFNGLAYVLFVLLIIKLGLSLRNNSRTRTSSVFNHPLAVGFVALMTQFSLMLKFTPSTAMYIWMYCLVLVYLDILLFNLPRSGYWAFLLFPFAVIAGNAHESINIGLALGLAIYGIRNIKKLTINEYAMLIGFAFGVILIALSPTSQKRGGSIALYPDMLLSLLYIKTTTIFFILLCLAIKKKKVHFCDFYKSNNLEFDSLIGCILFCVILMISIPRAWYGAEVFAMILSISIWPLSPLRRCALAFYISLVIAAISYQSFQYYDEMKETNKQHEDVKKLFIQSENGDVYYEFPSGDNAMKRTIKHFLFPYGPPNIFTNKGIFKHNDFTRETYEKSLNYDLGTNKKLRYLLPLERDILSMPDSNQVVETVPGNFYALVSKKNPSKKIVVYRSALWGFINWPEYDVDSSNKRPDFETNTLSVYSIFDDMFFVGIDSIIISN